MTASHVTDCLQRDVDMRIAVSSISYNPARSFGPAIGGLVVAAFGSVATFGINARPICR